MDGVSSWIGRDGEEWLLGALESGVDCDLVSVS